MIRLFIENTEIELTQQVDFAITKQWEDLTNPTVIINDWSKTIDIPFSKKNNETFGHIYLADRVIVKDASIANYVGLYFDPMRKLDFRLEYNDSVVMTGYAKMNRVNKKDGSGTYNITLNGTLGKVLQEMQKITFDDQKYTDTEDIRKYYISPSDSFGSAKITKNLVNTCWSNAAPNPQTYPSLQWIGFAPNNSFNDNFDYGSFQHLNTTTNEMEILKLTDVLNNTPAWQALHIDAGAVIDKGVLPKDFGEYRSYLQLPYIKFKKLFELFENKTLSATGYSIVKDSSWFNNSNPLWNSEVMMLKQLEVNKDSIKYNNAYNNMWADYNYNSWNDWYSTSDFSASTIKNLMMRGTYDEQLQIYNQYPSNATRFTLNNSAEKYVIFRFNYRFRIRDLAGNDYLKSNNGIIFSFTAVGENGIENSKTFLVRGTDSSITYGDATIISVSPTLDDTNSIYVDIEFLFTANQAKYGNYIYFKKDSHWLINEYPFAKSGAEARANILVNAVSSTMNVTIYEEYFRSDSEFTLNNLWNNDYSIYNIIMNYCKMHRILIQVDDNNKTINFTPAWKFFQNYTIEDWTNKIDMTHDYQIIVPCSFDNKYVLFNYKDNETKLGKEYLDKFGFKFGEMNLVTDYNFNTETKKLLDNPAAVSIVYSDNNLSWNDLINGKIRYVVPQDIIVYSKDDDGKYVDNFGAFYLFRGLTSFDANTNFNFRPAKISDDTDVMVKNNTYCYSQISDEMISVSKYPLLDIIQYNQMCIANKPSYNYTYNRYSYNNAQGIYQKYWSNYLSERYYSGNKKITCYLWIKPEDFIQFKFNKFVKIENQLYFVNKIYDYSLNENVTTKVDLISVNDISKYYRIN